MQFVKKGPDVPDALLQAHAEGQVVFFTGAGISYPAKLPGFKGLVEDVYAGLHETIEGTEKTAFNECRYDTVLDLLEGRLLEGRRRVRRALANRLKPERGRNGRQNHEALLKLSRHGEDLRLVTTNFDRLFENARRDSGIEFRSFKAPLLPVPKRTRWSGLVYLHGLLPRRSNDTELDHLVVSSGDFGRAYLTEGWAARFASELFRDFTVCFVGYSINDPVLRYMMDALAADRESGEERPEAFAFASFEAGRRKELVDEWEAKGVAPLPYEVDREGGGHERLTQTLAAWAELHRDGVRMGESFVEDSANSNPEASSKENDFAGRVLWAVSHPSGLPARRFARTDPAPPFAWLHTFSQLVLDANGNRVGASERGGQYRCSLLDRPSKEPGASTMHLAAWGDVTTRWDNVLRELVWWVVRYLGKPELLLWIVQRGARLHPSFGEAIQLRLAELSGLDAAAEQRERERSPEAIPSPPLLSAWRLLLAGQVREGSFNDGWHRWQKRVAQEGLSASLLMQMRGSLAPKIRLRKPIRLEEHDGESEQEPTQLWDVFDWDLTLATNAPAEALYQLVGSPPWSKKAHTIAELLTQLLLDGLELMEEVGAAGPEMDLSWFQQPSIEPHFQNRRFRKWVILIELLRDTWEILSEQNPGAARAIAMRWHSLPFPVFKRLALFAASQGKSVSPREWLAWLLDDESRWLWNSCIRREVLRLLARQGAALTVRDRQRLERAILAGRRREEREFDESLLGSRGVWVRLTKLRESGAVLGKESERVHKALEASNSWMRSDPQQREEFLSWMHGTGDPGFESQRSVDLAPREREALTAWLLTRAGANAKLAEETDWRALCAEEPRLAVHAVSDCAKLGKWPTTEWNTALYAWVDESARWFAWRRLANSILDMPADVWAKTESAVAFLVRQLADDVSSFRNRRNKRAAFIAVCIRLIQESNCSGGGSGGILDRAINHPLSQAIEALTNLWLEERTDDGDLPQCAWELLTKVCREKERHYRYGRVTLASRIASLYRVNATWCIENLVPLFSWETNEEEAAATWAGFLWAPQILPGLIEELADSLLSTAQHYWTLDNHHSNYCAVLVHVATRLPRVFPPARVKEALISLPDEGRIECAQALSRTLDARNDDERGERWDQLVQPFWVKAWPQDAPRSIKLSQALARVITKSGTRFPDALKELAPWLERATDTFFVTHELVESKLIPKHPQAALELIDAITASNSYLGPDTRTCLVEIAAADERLQHDQRFRRLEVELDRQGS